MKEPKLDKTKFRIQSFEEADHSVKYWRSRPWQERLQNGYYLSLRAFGYDPVNEPRMDKTAFKTRRRKQQLQCP